MPTLTLTATAPVTAPTQKLRDLIEGNACGMVLADELHNALMLLEVALGIPMTTPTTGNED